MICPRVALAGPQPPLGRGELRRGATERVGFDLLPDCAFATGIPGPAAFDLAVALGNSAIPVRAALNIRLNATSWSGRLDHASLMENWDGGSWPLAAWPPQASGCSRGVQDGDAQAHPCRAQPGPDEHRCAPASRVSFALAPEGTPLVRDLGAFDAVSGGAIVNAILYVLARLPGVEGRVRSSNPTRADLSNLNRYMLLSARACTNSLRPMVLPLFSPDRA